MANDIFLKVDGIPGESTDVSHNGEIEVVGWSWGVSEVFLVSGSGGPVSGKPQFQNLSVNKHVDKASPRLLRACITATRISQVVLTQRRAGAGNPDLLVITLQDALVASVDDIESDAAPRPLEIVRFTFGKVSYQVIPQKPDGKPDAPVILNWDVKANKEF